MAAIGWYGPLIDLCRANSHIGEYVQLLVLVHRTRPIQKFKSSRGALLRTDIQVGDDTCLFFAVSLRKKEMGSIVVAGDVVLLQNVEIVKYGGIVEARSSQFSSLLPLVPSFQLLASEGLNDLLTSSRVGKTTQEKLTKVIKWVQQAGLMLHNLQLSTHQNRQVVKNWKVNEEMKYLDCMSISEVSGLKSSCKATFYASVGEIFLPFFKGTDEEYQEQMFIRRRLFVDRFHNIVEDLICMGCKLCGYPRNWEDRCLLGQKNGLLYCPKSSNNLHAMSLIYRTFLLYVWDESEHIPLLVTNKSAEILFGNITAEQVHLSYKEETIKNSNRGPCAHIQATKEGECCDSQTRTKEENPQQKNIKQGEKRINFYKIWIILLKLLLQHGRKSSPLRFSVMVNTELSQENGRFELINVTVPCINKNSE